MKPRLLDLFGGEGGCAKGYMDAGFDVTSVDIEVTDRNPATFIQADAMTYPLDGFDAVHASPPCQAFSVATKAWNGRIKRDAHPDLLTPMRERLKEWGGPYVIENVPGAPMLNAIQLCGSSFGLAVQRHRLFESNVPLMALPCAHHLQQERKYPPTRSDRTTPARVVSVFGAGGGRAKNAALWAVAMDIDWMTKHGLGQAIPPAYTEFIGAQLVEYLTRQEASLAA